MTDADHEVEIEVKTVFTECSEHTEFPDTILNVSLKYILTFSKGTPNTPYVTTSSLLFLSVPLWVFK